MKNLMMVALMLVAATAFVGCNKEETNPTATTAIEKAEKAGKDAAKKVEEGAKKAGEAVSDAAAAAKKKVEEATKK